VDDDEAGRDVVAMHLEGRGATVVLASSAAAALEILERDRFDVLLIDIAMPDRDGYDLLRAMRDLSGRAADIPAVALTAYASDEDRARSLAAGFKAHLSKPIEPGELVETVARVATSGRGATVAG